VLTLSMSSVVAFALVPVVVEPPLVCLFLVVSVPHL
jgi:hypothetical protein